MPQVKSLDELKQLRQQLQKDIKARTEATTTITVGMGTCGIAAGAREVMQAVLDQLASRGVEAHVTTVGCIGMCSKEPLVDVKRGDEPKITYGNVTPAMVSRIVDEHLGKGQVIEEWVVARTGTAA
jgi:NADP-reducing hydrogenase subunit HndB